HVALSCQVESSGQSAQSASQDGDAFLFFGERGDFFRKFGSVIKTRLFDGNNSQGFAGFLPFAHRSAGLIADPANNPWKRDRFLENFCRFREVSMSRFGHHGPNVHMDGTGGGAVGGLFLNALVFQFMQFVLFHGSEELPSDERHAVETMRACSESSKIQNRQSSHPSLLRSDGSDG